MVAQDFMVTQGGDTVRTASNGGISEAILWTPIRDGKPRPYKE